MSEQHEGPSKGIIENHDDTATTEEIRRWLGVDEQDLSYTDKRMKRKISDLVDSNTPTEGPLGIASPKDYVTRKIDVSKIETIEDVRTVLGNMNLQWFGERGDEPDSLVPYLLPEEKSKIGGGN